jgi:hypothetical protein
MSRATVALLLTFLALALGVAAGVASLPAPGGAEVPAAVQHLDTSDRDAEPRPHTTVVRPERVWPAHCSVGIDELEASGLTEAQAFAARVGCGMDDVAP